MDRFKPPAKPPGFDAKVKPFVSQVRAHFKRKKPRTWAFDNLWGAHKREIANASHKKCAYCEMRVIGGQDGDVEHFFPKGEVWALHDDPATWGQEEPGLSNVAGRKRIILATTGYWWLAYEWSNYLLACMVCNQKWKLSFFPVRSKHRKLPPSPRIKEEPLLLNPFSGPDPAKHLEFLDTGSITPHRKSRHGYETIRTCGLDRPSLTVARFEKAQRAHQLLKDLARHALGSIEHDKALEDFYKMGKKQNDHSGMVRSIFEQNTGQKWSQLEKLFAGP